MKLQKPEWLTESPGPLRGLADFSFFEMAKNAAKAGREQDVLEDFKWRFSNGVCKRSSCAKDADSDLYWMMKKAAENAPVFVAQFADACSDLREQGIDAPSVAAINRTLHLNHCEWQIEGDMVVRRSWYVEHDEEIGQSAAHSNDASDADNDIGEPAGAEPVNEQEQSPAAVVPRAPRFYGGGTIPIDVTRRLKVFLCHSSGDKDAVRALYTKLRHDEFQPWLDEEDLLPGQSWEIEIPRAVKDSDIVIVFLSKGSVTKTGYVQKEIKFALDAADERPERSIFIIPALLEECTVPDRLAKWHWVALFKPGGYNKLLASLKRCESAL